ncbi:hypothetical protein [Candidatus Hodarchaeum mangrovi]
MDKLYAIGVVYSVKEVVDQIKSVVSFCGFEVESILSRQFYITFDLKSKSRFRKRTYILAVSNGLTGILTAERELSRNARGKALIYDPINHLPEPTFDNVILFHDLDTLQQFLSN